MISWGETFLIIGTAAVLYGPKDLPKVAKRAGGYVGQLVVYMRRLRSSVDSFAKEHELLGLQKEVRESLLELNSIRSDIQRNMNVMPSMYAQIPWSPRPTVYGNTAQQSTGTTPTGSVTSPSVSTVYPNSNFSASPSSFSASPSSASAGVDVSRDPMPTSTGATHSAESSSGAAFGGGMIRYAEPSSDAAVNFAPKTESIAGGADFILDMMAEQERLRRAAALIRPQRASAMQTPSPPHTQSPN